MSSECGHCKAAIEFDLTVTDDGATSPTPIARTLREWDPLFTEADRAAPHVLDGF